MSLLSRFAPAMVIPAAAALLTAGSGTAHAAGDLYGSIAVSTFRVGAAADYPTQHEADQAALAACGESTCYIPVRIHNECGSVVERDARSLGSPMPFYFTGTGATAAEAEANAMRIAGPEPTGMLFVEITKPAFVLDTICTANAG
ncbi:DUF4189 domain-containing protein [Nocardia sp. NPDC127526]|uniref:DUF4189 domain-containing protein n=1 Tax=Nocardia sp. NPDC127526 TaxID=3345393 RepID=UPI00363F7C4A